MAPCTWQMLRFAVRLLAVVRCSFLAKASTCPGSVNVEGYGKAVMTNAGSNVPGQAVGSLEVSPDGSVTAHLDARVYFADSCTEGSYDHTKYWGLKLLGRTLKFTTDISGAGCGCNAALYLTSLKQNPEISTCNDYYCDANQVCGVSCAEVDIMEANKRAWHSTLHSAQDHSGKGGGFGGGSGWNGPRDFNAQQYGPGGSCIDTSMPFNVEVSFPVDAGGQLQAMKVTLTQTGKSCPLGIDLDGYAGMAEIHDALDKGMTPIISYWKSGDMLWMDGKGSDGQGPCAVDAQQCGETVKFSGFRLEAMPGQPPLEPVAPVGPEPAATMVPPAVLPPLVPVATVPPPLMPVASTSRAQIPLPPAVSTSRWINRVRPSLVPVGPAVTPAPLSAPATSEQQCSATNKDCRNSHCCEEPGMQCYQKNQWWASCKRTCSPGIDRSEKPEFQLPWDCKPLGERSGGSAGSAKHDQVVVKVRQGLLPQNAETGTDVTLTVGGKKVRAKIVSVKRGVQGTAASPSGPGSSASVRGSTAAWSVVSFFLTLTALAAVGLWTVRSRAGDAAPEWLRNFPKAGDASTALERWQRGQVVTTPRRGGAAQQSPMQQSPGASPPSAAPAPPTSNWFLNTFDRLMNRQQETPRQQGRQALMW